MKKKLLSDYYKFKEPFREEYMGKLYAFLQENRPKILNEMNKVRKSIMEKLRQEENEKTFEEFNKHHKRWFELLNQGVDYLNKHLEKIEEDSSKNQ